MSRLTFMWLWIGFNVADAICYLVADNPPHFHGWLVPGSGFYALVRWGLRW